MRYRFPLAARRAAIVLALVTLPCGLFHRALLRGEAFLPADLLGGIAPWKAAPQVRPQGPWNVLRLDGIAQFYPWRLQVRRSFRAGRLPLRNPYALGAEGGAPLLANSQSAPLYPPNLLFTLLPALWQAFGVSAALHLLIAAAGAYAFLRALRLSRPAGLLGATTWALSGPVITWLALPTFLAVSCWLPSLLLCIRRAHTAPARNKREPAAWTLGAGAITGLLLLAGHLQVAFYCLLAAGLYALWLGGGALRRGRVRLVPWLAGMGAAVGLALALAAPQILPAIALSRVSHRVAAPDRAGYRIYSANALPPRNFVTALAPDFFGHPNAGTYWNTNNYAEWALYVGVAPLLLAAYALALPWKNAKKPPPPQMPGDPPAERGFFAGLGLLALLMALGTPVNLPFFWGVPGFAQTGSPARSLLLVAFSLAMLAAFGLEALLAARGPRRGAWLAAVAGPVLLGAVGASLAARFAREAVPVSFGALMATATLGLLRAGALVLLTGLLLAILPRLPAGAGARSVLGGGACLALSFADLMTWGMGYNPTVPPDAVFPATPGIRWLQENAAGALIAPLNRGWSLGAQPPALAVLPPNTLTVYGLHDLGGYDSLLPRRAKQRVRDAGGGEDPSPPENGNIVFIKSVAAARALGARFLVAAPEAAGRFVGTGNIRGMRPVYTGEDLVIFENPEGRMWRPPPPDAADDPPTPIRLGLFLGLCGCGALAAGALWLGITEALTRRRVSRRG